VDDVASYRARRGPWGFVAATFVALVITAAVWFPVTGLAFVAAAIGISILTFTACYWLLFKIAYAATLSSSGTLDVRTLAGRRRLEASTLSSITTGGPGDTRDSLYVIRWDRRAIRIMRNNSGTRLTVALRGRYAAEGEAT
jgi:hypothetical protein